jgi:hypothetical protein
MREGSMADIVEETSQAESFSEPRVLRSVMALEERIKNQRSDVHHADRVEISRVSGAGKNVFRESELLDVPEALEKRMLEYFYFRIFNRN